MGFVWLLSIQVHAGFGTWQDDHEHGLDWTGLDGTDGRAGGEGRCLWSFFSCIGISAIDARYM